ncbi:heterogeneous nuclear ribonucleoprotein U-like protein 1 [Tanacetum coccineum]
MASSSSSSSVKRERDQNPSPAPDKKPRLFHHHHRVLLNPADCDLDFNIEENGLEGSALYEKGFAYCWSGARANIGITGGRYCFSCKVVSAQPVDLNDTHFDEKHLCRVGVSRGDDKVGNLGETEHSFGFGGTGKFSNAANFSAYGERFGIGDTILCAVDLESRPMASISFAKNGKWLGTATHFNAGPNGLGVIDSPIKELYWESGIFPHLLLKNVVVRLQFSYEDGLVPLDGYKPWASAFGDGKGVIGPAFSDVGNCELIMMVGLPASGKTTWAEKWVNDHPEKRYILLGTNLALDQMKVPGLHRKHNYGERFNHLMDRATGIFNTLITRASRTPRNFIIDQTNVYKSARRHKLKPFAYYQKIAVVCFPRPEDLKARSEKRLRETGKDVPADAVNEMLANFVLPKSKDMPGTDEYFDQVVYIELNMTESQICLNQMKAKLQSGITVSPYLRESSLNPMRYPQKNVLQPHWNSTHQYPPESTTHVSHSMSRHCGQGNILPTYDMSTVQYQTTPSGQHLQGSYQSQSALPNMPRNEPCNARFLPRDDFNHRRSYSGYEHRAITPMVFSDSYQKNPFHGAHIDCQTPGNETMDLSPRYTANMNHPFAPVERHATSPSSLYDTYGGPASAPHVDMHTQTHARSLPINPNALAHLDSIVHKYTNTSMVPSYGISIPVILGCQSKIAMSSCLWKVF